VHHQRRTGERPRIRARLAAVRKAAQFMSAAKADRARKAPPPVAPLRVAPFCRPHSTAWLKPCPDTTDRMDEVVPFHET